MSQRRSPLTFVVLLGFVLTAATGCGYSGANSHALPFGTGSGSDALTATVQLDNAGNLVPNSEVKLDDVTVGQVRTVEFDSWTARLEIGLDPAVRIPAGVRAQVAQKSLLGAQYVELVRPDGAVAESPGLLADGATIEATGLQRYPDTEQVLSAAGLLFGGGGLEHVATINRELNQALGGREGDWRALLGELEKLVGRADSQRGEIVRLLDSSGRLAGQLAAQRSTIAKALRLIPQGAAVLDELRPKAVEALKALRRLSDHALPVVRASREDLIADLKNVALFLEGVGSAGKDLPGALGILTFPLATDVVPSVVRGDYANVYIDLDLTLETLDQNFLTGTPLAGVLAGVNGAPPPTTSTTDGDPLRDPVPDQPEPAPAPDEGKGPDGARPPLEEGLSDLLLGRLGGGQ